MRPRLIGFCGPAGAGKTFAANHLASHYGYSRVRFAGPLKAMLRALGLTEAEVDGELKEQACALLGGRTPRHAMQALGTEWGRQLISSELWINAWAHASAHYLLQGLPVVVDDVRFANEAAAIWRRKGVLIRIDRAAAPASAACAAHASENQALHYDARIVNSGDPDEFRAALDGLVRRDVV
ncbi:deoxynucleotide monophosphate kinase [Rhodoblastus sp. 17X3]|uniref:deoxynucleotide monophosphate kinase n=1 Tax=Rhodoblastus sp. 17X3 TaxID=3047026 RepID=UPI0024B7F66B|nr:deoxynucleotide monophosphate kinase [Rhodoblastus sp. 17X3]MDI9847397.1 deoxynucleotide monophosphate kinase [Rhodoblastus sp. 17X3]